MCKFCDCTKQLKYKRNNHIEIHYASEASVNDAEYVCSTDSAKTAEKDELGNVYDYDGRLCCDEGFCIEDGDMLTCYLEAGYAATRMKIKHCPICNKELKHIDAEIVKEDA